MKTLHHRRALVTGGAGGLGTAIGRALAAGGAEVVLTDLDPVALDRAADRIAQDVGRRPAIIAGDVTAPELETFRERVHHLAGPINLLVNNAGVVFGGPFLDVELERHRTTFAVNTVGVVTMTHAFLPDLIAGPEGHLVNVASASGFVGLPYGSTYAASKWAVIGFSESLRLELERHGHEHVHVTTVCPSYVDTGMFEGAAPPKLTRFLDPDELASKIVDAIHDEKPFVLEPWLVKLTPFLAHALPGALSDRLADLFGATQSMKGWTGRTASRAASARDSGRTPESE